MDSFLFGNTLNNLNESGFFEISSGSPTASDVGNSLNNLDELPWDVLLSRRVDPDSRKVIRKEIIRRCPDFETKLYGDQWNLIHLASEYGHLEIVKVLLISTTNGGMNPCVRLDIDAKSPLDYAAMKGREDVIDVLLDALPLSATASYVNNIFVRKALYLALTGNQRQAFCTLSKKYIENWDIKKKTIIETTSKLLMEADPMPSEDVPTHDVFEALNQKLLLTIQQQYFLVENFLASDPLLFRALCSRSCPLLTQLYFCVLTRQTDDLMEELNKMSYEFEPAKRQEHIYPYPLHDVSTWGYIHMVELILIYGSGLSSVCLLKDTDGETPLHCAAQTGRVSVINMLLSTCWECAGMVSDKRNETALHCALRNNQTKAFKALLEWYIIKEEFLNNNARDWECGPCGDTPLELLVEGYAKIVKELLCQSGSKICFQKEFWKGKEYFVVIKCKKMESFGNSFEYGDYIREVTSRATNRTILSLSVDSRSIITLKVLIRSVMVRGILDVRDVDNNTVFDLLDETKEVRKTNLMGFVPYQRYENVIWLLDAIQMGDYQAFSKLQAEDPHILDYVCELPLGGTPLHIAVRFGQLNDCTREIIRKRPEFAETRDHKERNPLHIAAAKGYFEIVKELVTQVGFSQCFASDYVEGADTMDWGGEFYGTPLDYAIKNGRTSVVSELLPIWWKCGGVLREGNSKLLRLAVAFKQFEALKMLMERYIEDELLKAKEVDGNPMSALADGYIEIVLKHLLCPKVDYSLSILVKNRDAGKKKGTKHPLSLYFAVIKVTSTGSRRKDNNIVDQMLLSAYYPKYFREVTVQNKIVLHLSVDQENSVTLKLLLRSPLFYQLDYTYGHDFFCNVFDSLLDDLENEVVENEMGTLIPIWSNDAIRSSSKNVHDDAQEQLGEGAKNGILGDGNEQQLSVAVKEDDENVKAGQRNDNADQDRISLCIGQRFASREECLSAIKDAAILCSTEINFTRSSRERIVAICSDTSCEWEVRANIEKNSKLYVVARMNKHTCPRLNCTTNKLASPVWVSNHIIDKVRRDHNISQQEIIEFIKTRYRIDIQCRTANDAKKRALNTIHESQIVSKTRRKNMIASSNAHQSHSNSMFLEQIPAPMHEYIHSTEDVAKDGHCGYSVIALQSGYDAIDAWKQVRRELLCEIIENEVLYGELMGIDTVAKMRKAFAYFKDHAFDPHCWLSLHDAGYVIANAYNAVVVSLSLNSGNLTFLPLLEPPPEGRPHRIITFGFIDGNHFISVNLKPDAPIPRVDRVWHTYVSEAAKVWKTLYLNRFEKFEVIMGSNLSEGENTNNGRCPIILES